MIDRLGFDTIEDGDRKSSDIIDLVRDQNGNEHFDIEQAQYLRMLHESSPDPDSLSIISDYSVMGQEIKQSIRFSDMIMSTYSDLKNPNKSITVVPNTKTDSDMVFRKYNMLSLAMEFSKWKESSVDLSVEESMSDNDSRCVKGEECSHDTTMVSHSPSLVSDFSSVGHYSSDHRDDNGVDGIASNICVRSPLQVHIDQKFEETFSGNRSSSESETGEDSAMPRLNISRPAWAQSIFHRESLMKMSQTIQQAASSIKSFDLSKKRCLEMLNVSQLQLVLNGLMAQIEDLNESLVATLISRDELRSEQTSMVIRVEELTIKAKNEAQRMRIRLRNTQTSVSATHGYGIMHRFLTNLMCSPRFASNRVISFFSQNTQSDVPPPEYV